MLQSTTIQSRNLDESMHSFCTYGDGHQFHQTGPLVCPLHQSRGRTSDQHHQAHRRNFSSLSLWTTFLRPATVEAFPRRFVYGDCVRIRLPRDDDSARTQPRLRRLAGLRGGVHRGTPRGVCGAAAHRLRRRCQPAACRYCSNAYLLYQSCDDDQRQQQDDYHPSLLMHGQ